MEIPRETDVLESVTNETFRLKNWVKPREDKRHSGPYPYADAFDDLDGQRFTRSRVFADFDQCVRKGVISAIKWGYPRGRLPGGGWHSFSDALRSASHAEEIERLRDFNGRALELVQRLNQVMKGIGTATTTKMAYFAGLTTVEGACLIYDSMVRRAIRNSRDPDIADDRWLRPLRDGLLQSRRDLSPAGQEATYGTYLEAVAASAAARRIRLDQLELALFREGRKRECAFR